MKPKRLKWEPGVLMVLVLGLGFWIAFGAGMKPRFPVALGSITQDIRVGSTRGALEARPIVGDAATHSNYGIRLWWMDEKSQPQSSRELSMQEATDTFGPGVVQELLGTRRNAVFRTLNITSWSNLVWVGIGLLGQIAFSGRMVLQWITSEKERKSVITESFWWFSLFGGVTLFSYFVWRQDPVGILGQASGIVIYARNIRLLRKHAARTQRELDKALMGMPVKSPK